MTGDHDIAEPSNDYTSANARARYVVERLSGAVLGPTEQDWAHIRKELTRAYRAIDNAQRGNLLRLALQRAIIIVVAYAIVSAFHWQLDRVWAAQEFSLRVFISQLL